MKMFIESTYITLYSYVYIHDIIYLIRWITNYRHYIPRNL